MVNWFTNNAALIKWGNGYTIRRVLFMTHDRRPVVKINGEYQIPDTDWLKIGEYRRGIFWGWRL